METRTVGEVAAALDKEARPKTRRRRWIPGMPMEVALAYSAALNVSSDSPAMYSVALLRVLEKVFAEQEASGNGLLARIDHLCECGTVPKEVPRLAYQLRDAGLSPAAPLESEPDKQRTFEDLVVAILDHTYAEPLRASRFLRGAL